MDELGKKGFAIPEILRLGMFCIQQAGDCIYWLDRKGRIVFGNQKTCDVLGYSRQELEGRTVFDIEPGLTGERWEARWKALREGEPLIAESFHRGKGGRVFPVEVTENRMVCDGREYICSFARDLSERKNTERQLAHFSAIVNQSQDAIFGANLDGIVTSWNPGAEQLYGYEAAEMIGKPVMKLVPPDRQHEFTEAFDRLKSHGRVERYDTVRRRKDGSLVDVSANLSTILDNNGQVIGVSAIAHEITARKRAEERLCESEERLANIVQNAAETIYTLSLDGVFTFVSPAWTEKLGHDVSEIKGQHFARFIHPDDLAVCLEGIDAALATGKPQQGTYRIRHKDGSWRWHHTSGSLAKDKQGRPSYFIGVAEDVTEWKRAAEELLNHAKSLEAANRKIQELNMLVAAASRAKSEFLTNMSHEIRAPLTAILGFTDLLLEDESLEGAASGRIEAIKTIQRNGRRLLEVISDIRDLSKIEAGKHDLDLQACSPWKIVSEVMDAMKVRADAKGLRLSVEYQRNVPLKITSDPIRLRQILVTLIGNAIKFTEKGSVRVVVQPDSACDDVGKLRFDIIDTGIGIAPDHIPMLFQPFSQVDVSASRCCGGTGLELAISKRLAEMLKGDITVASLPGEGTSFSLSIGTGLPAEARRPQHSTEPSEPRTTAKCDLPALNCRILLAEDGPDNQWLISRVLRKAGAEVSVVEDGEQAVEQALGSEEAGGAFDLVLMDVRMPVLDGYEATRALRAKGYRGPIVALTACAMKDDRQRCLYAGCDDYLTKPIDRRKLLETVARHVAADRCLRKQSGPDCPPARVGG